MENTFLTSNCDGAEVEWLQAALSPLGKVVGVGGGLEEIFRLIEMMNVSIVFMGVSRRQQVHQCSFVESLLEARPMVSVVAVGDGYDSELVIAAMRAGARDFITSGLRGSEVLALVRRISSRLPSLPVRAEQGSLTLVFGAQADVDAAFVTAHIALALAGDKDTLLVDMGAPQGESLAILGVDCSFSLDDAIRNVRRLDSAVIESAFVRSEGGLAILPLLENDHFLESCTYAEAILLLGIMRQHFSKIVVNATGQSDCDVVRALVDNASHIYWHTDQSIPCSRRNLALLERWRADGVKLGRIELLVDRYLPKMAPDAGVLSQTFAMPLAACLPLKAPLRLECRNQSRSLFDIAPRDELSKKLQELAARLTEGSRRSPPGLVQRLRALRW